MIKIDLEKKAELELNSLKRLTQRQFKLALLSNDLLDTVTDQIRNIPDDAMRQRIQVEFESSTHFVRTSDSILYMQSLLELTDIQLNEMWKQALEL